MTSEVQLCILTLLCDNGYTSFSFLCKIKDIFRKVCNLSIKLSKYFIFDEWNYLCHDHFKILSCIQILMLGWPKPILHVHWEKLKISLSHLTVVITSLFARFRSTWYYPFKCLPFCLLFHYVFTRFQVLWQPFLFLKRQRRLMQFKIVFIAAIF